MTIKTSIKRLKWQPAAALLPFCALAQTFPGGETEEPIYNTTSRVLDGGAAAVSGLTFSEEVSDIRRNG
ncbi:MAG: hypothetical protein AAFY03_11780, partial [Pseudomonadota bacterium]